MFKYNTNVSKCIKEPKIAVIEGKLRRFKYIMGLVTGIKMVIVFLNFLNSAVWFF